MESTLPTVLLTVLIASGHVLILKHGNRQVEGITTSIKDGLLAATEARNSVTATVSRGCDSSRDEGDDSEEAAELHCGEKFGSG